MPAILLQVNVKPATARERGMPKRPVIGSRLTFAGVVGDFNRYRHDEQDDDPAMAVLLMPIETLEELNREGWPIQPGDVGENLTTRGLVPESLQVGTRILVGQAEIELSKPAEPCRTLFTLPYVGSQRGPDCLKALKGRRGWYARVLREGDIAPGDEVHPVVPGLESPKSATPKN